MELWTTFTPQKISWEVTCISTQGKSPSDDWQKNIGLVDSSLKKLKQAGISGIRLVIYPAEITTDGKSFKFSVIDKVLNLSKKHGLKVDLCIGPFQYPNYPGIYIPSGLVRYVFDNKRCIDTVPQLWKYGMNFLKLQIEHFGTDKRIHGFHLANEWPDPQKVKGREKIKASISESFMIEASKYLKENTQKPILINTNIDANDKKRLKNAFGEILEILGTQIKLGFDVYPSQFTWKRNPFRKVLYLIWPYFRFFRSFQNKYIGCEMYFAEVEAQPWGRGQSWFQLINEAEEPNEKVLLYTKDSLKETWNKFIKNSNCGTVSLWGSDFWLSADAMGIKWPLAQIKQIFII